MKDFYWQINWTIAIKAVQNLKFSINDLFLNEINLKNLVNIFLKVTIDNFVFLINYIKKFQLNKYLEFYPHPQQ